MGKYLNIGNAGFTAVRKGNYVDKTGMLSFLNRTLGTKSKLTCVSRPRRFGKSFAAQMICAYYDKSCDSRALFEGLAISEDCSFETYLNKYHVIYLDITLFTSRTSDMKNVVRNINDAVLTEVLQSFQGIEKGADLVETLVHVTEKTGEKFIMIIDEWDAIFREAKEDEKLQREYIDLLRSLFKSSWTDIIFDAAYITGILPIKKYGTQSAMTDFKEYTMTQPEPLEEFAGFTEQEVQNLCADSSLAFEDVQKWYDGYVLGTGIHIYSPKSVMEAIQRKRIGNYWTQSETYESLRLYIDLNEDGLKEAIVQMLGGAHIRIDVATFQNNMTTMKSRDDVLTLLVHLGYLAYDIDCKSVYIPNEEVREEFIRAVTVGRHTEIARLIRNSDQLLEATLNMDEEAVAAAIEQIKNKDYPQVLKDYGGDILLVGINYDAKSKRHTCKIEKYRK